MNILITYFSLSGNTAKIAQSIHQAVLSDKYQVEIKKLSSINVADLYKYDLVFLGSACHDTGLAKPVKQLLSDIHEAPHLKIAGFVTHSTEMPSDSAHQRELYEQWAGNCLPTYERMCNEKNITFLGYFHCQGRPSASIAEFIHNAIITEDKEWETYITEVMKHPDHKDTENAKAFAMKILDTL